MEHFKKEKELDIHDWATEVGIYDDFVSTPTKMKEELEDYYRMVCYAGDEEKFESKYKFKDGKLFVNLSEEDAYDITSDLLSCIYYSYKEEDSDEDFEIKNSEFLVEL